MTDDGKFEIGDTVICIEAPGPDEYPLEVGTIFTITDIDYDWNPTLRRLGSLILGECFRAELFKLHQPFGTHKILKRGTDAGQTNL